MSLRTRTAIYVALTMLVLTLIFVFFGAQRVDTGFNRLDRNDATKSVNLVRNWLGSQSAPAKNDAMSYADWTPAYRLVQHPTKAVIRDFAANKLPPGTLESMNTDFMIFMDARGNVVYSQFVRHGELRDQVVAAAYDDPRFTAFTKRERLIGRAATVATTSGPVAVGVAPIVRDDNATIPSNGVILAGRFLDGETVKARLTDQTGLDGTATAWYSTRQADLPPAAAAAADQLAASGARSLVKRVSDDQIDGYAILTGLAGKPAAVVKVRVDPVIWGVRSALLRDSLIGLLVFIIVTIAALVIALDTSLLNRLTGFIRGVREIGTADEQSGVRVPVMGRDEIAELATSVNSMLEAIDEQRDGLVKLATVDALTSVFNRRRFVEELRRELEKSKRLGQSGALLWFDVDHFKDINDTYGHTTGDHVLVGVAGLLGAEMRAYCTLARLGGDEFVMLMPGADRDEARYAAERLLSRFEQTELDVDGHVIKVGLSIGVAFYPTHGDTVEALLESADNAMYDSKRVGRGCVTMRPEPGGGGPPAPPAPPATAPGPTEPATA